MNISTEIDVPLKTMAMAAAELAPDGGYVVTRRGDEIVVLTQDGYRGPPIAEIRQRARALEDEVVAAIGKSRARETIVATAGDTDSLLGTTADTTQLLLHSFSSLIAKLHTAKSLAEVREAARPFAQLSERFLTRLDKEEVKLPYLAKGVETVMTDIETRATAVAEALQSATNGG